MSPNTLYRFTCYIDSIVDKHKMQVRRFRLSRTQWGNTSTMIERINRELWETAGLYDIDPDKKKQIIDTAIQTIRSCYQ